MRKEICIALSVCMGMTMLWGCGNEKQKTSETTVAQGVETVTIEETTAVQGVETVTVEETTTSGETEANIQSQEGGYSLTEVGKIPDADKKVEIGYYNFEGVSLIGNGSGKLLTYLGEDKLNKDYLGCKLLVDGVYTVASSGEGPNIWGVVDNKGEELIPCEAASVETLSERYLKVIYTTGETKKKSECFVYSTNSMLSLDVEEGDTMYKGYALIYDLENSRFVPNIKVTYAPGEIEVCGESIYIEDESVTKYIYNAEGKVVYKTEKNITLGNGVFVVYIDGEYRAFDENGTKLFEIKDSLDIIDGDGQYFSTRKDEKTIILDKNGEKISVYPGEYISKICEGVVMGSSNSKYGLHKIDGTEIEPFESESLYSYIRDGYWYSTDDTYKKYELINSDGVVASNLEGVDSENLIFKMSDKTNLPLLVLNSPDSGVVTKKDYPEILTVGLVADGEEDDYGYAKYGVLDLFTGAQLLDYEYEEIKYDSGYIYAYKDGGWTIYQVNK